MPLAGRCKDVRKGKAQLTDVLPYANLAHLRLETKLERAVCCGHE